MIFTTAVTRMNRLQGTAAFVDGSLDRDGVCLVRGGLDAAEMRLAAACFDWSIANPSSNFNEFQPTAEHPGRFCADINNPHALAPGGPYEALFTRSSLGARLSQFWGGSDVWFLYEQVLMKEGGDARRTPWHQDSSYLPIAGDMMAIVWITLEPLSREYALEVVRGSHRGPLYDGSTFAPGDDTDPLYGDDSMPRLPDIERERERWPIAGWDIEPGDLLLFHPAALHGGAPTRAGMRRCTVSLRFFGEDAIYKPLPADGVERIGIEGETLWKKLRRTLRSGDRLLDPAMPKVWPSYDRCSRANHQTTSEDSR